MKLPLVRSISFALAASALACTGGPSAAPSQPSPIDEGDRAKASATSGVSVFGYSSVWHTNFCFSGSPVFEPGGGIYAPNDTCKVGDVNNDGMDDLISFSYGAHSQVLVALSNGSGFGPPQVWQTSFCGDGQTCDVGDVNGDGSVDIVAFTQGVAPASTVQVAFSNGASAFGAAVQVQSNFCNAGNVCKVADLNNDGRADVVAFTHSAASSEVWASLSQEGMVKTRFAPPFAPTTRWSTSFCTPSQQCQLGDVNGDGLADAVAFESSGLIWVGTQASSVFNGGSGQTEWGYSFCTFPQQCVLADVTGDGVADAVEFMNGNDGTTNVKVSIASPSTKTFAPPVLFDDAFCPAGECMVGDFNGDTDSDLVYFSQGSSHSASVALGGNSTRLLNNGWPGMTGAQHPVYLTFYGNFSYPATPSILTSFTNALGGSPYLATLTSYGVPNSLYVAGVKTVAGEPQGQNLDGTSENTILTNAWGKLDPSSLYVIALGSDVTDNGCGFVGFHTEATPVTSPPVFYTVIKNAVGACDYTVQTPNAVTSPNDDPEADAMASVLAHEVAEMLTDGAGFGWNDEALGESENADLCAWKWGSTYTAPNGSVANVHLNGADYLIQEIFKNGQGNDYCAGAPFSPAPVSFWTFDLAQQTNLVNDIMPARNNAVASNARTGQGLAHSGQSIFFNGRNSYVAVPDSTSLRFASTGVTVSVWIYLPAGSFPSQLGHMFNVLDKQNGSSGWGLWIDASNRPGFNTDGGGGSAVSSFALPTSPSFVTHLVGTYKPGGAVKIYVDGALAGSAPASTATDNTQAIWVGSSAYWQNNFATGYIDDVAIWNQELQAGDVARLYQLHGGPY